MRSKKNARKTKRIRGGGKGTTPSASELQNRGSIARTPMGKASASARESRYVYGNGSSKLSATYKSRWMGRYPEKVGLIHGYINPKINKLVDAKEKLSEIKTVISQKDKVLILTGDEVDFVDRLFKRTKDPNDVELVTIDEIYQKIKSSS